MRHIDSVPRLPGSVLCLADPADAAERGFAHALTLALFARGELTLLGAHREHEPPPALPELRETLARWQLLPEGSSRSEVHTRLGVKVRKHRMVARSPVAEALERAAGRHDLVVTSSISESWPAPGGREKGAPALLVVPGDARGFAAPADGHLSLRRILVAMHAAASTRAALALARELARQLGDLPVTMLLLGLDGRTPPALPERPEEGCRWRRLEAWGDPAGEMLSHAARHDVDLVVLATPAAKRGLRASAGARLAERVLAGARCPVLAVPESWRPRGPNGTRRRALRPELASVPRSEA